MKPVSNKGRHPEAPRNGACAAKDPDYQALLHKLKQLELEKLELARQVKSLKRQNELYREENQDLRIELLCADEEARAKEDVTAVGYDIRVRFLEKYRQRMDGDRQRYGDMLVEKGNRAAHRGRPLADARVVECGDMDEEVFEDLYGIWPETLKRWENIPELTRVVGMRGSLRSEGVECDEFEETFCNLLDLEECYRDVEGLEEAFRRNPAFLKYVRKLEVLFAALEEDGSIRTKLLY